ncbi:protein RMD5 homolog A-like [Chenopodium quinoa]|uniref:protein RMD5 homolog A-like n=1 Tax=Chenopodium quinoa TaxID=63459 RepID=UPI000B7752D7|nr:protein RMD5 homolog A-like [Chenopodium quinoa]XP_021717204.1 protein RMD5 homolog A-like [Chenopodium quinoa]XP_021717206.1 protein RMD5 homolog A-like [Chenopodium quinoa]
MELNKIKESFEHVVKKRKLSSSKCHEVVDTIDHELKHALSRVQLDQNLTVPEDHKSILRDLKSKLSDYGSEKELENSQKELNLHLNKSQKLLEKVLNPYISKGNRKIDFDVQTINQIIIDHLFFKGLFDVGDCLSKEAVVPEVNVLRSQFFEMSQILEALHIENLQPAFNWVSANHEKLRENGSSLELKLHQVRYVELLKQGSQTDALNYARSNLAPLATLHMDEVKKLMACLLWIGKLDKCPYWEKLAMTNWKELADELLQQFCVLLGRSCRPPLAVAVEAGSEALPILLKLVNLMAVKQDWQGMEELSFPVDLGKGFQFHSTFICPVTRDQGTLENPPMLLPCGHVLCRQSVMSISLNNSRTFKCPCCPRDNIAVAQCKQLHLP